MSLNLNIRHDDEGAFMRLRAIDGNGAKRALAAACAGALLAGALSAHAGVFGSLANFDVVNDTGGNAYGFEIEIDDPLFDHTKLTSVFGYDRNFGLPGGPGAVERYGLPTITDLPGTGVLIRYGGSIAGAFTPSGTYNTPGESCWPLAGGWSTAAPCDHFGVSTLGQPAATSYRWLVESAPGSGLLVARQAGIPAVNLNYTPPPAPAAPGVVAARVDAVAPNHDQPENEAAWGEPFWVKTLSTPVQHNIDLRNLFRDDHDQEQAQVETEWEIFQKAPAGEQGGNDVKENQVALNDQDKALVRRYEFYKYLGPLTAEGEADCKGACEKDPLGLDPKNPHPSYVGAFVGAQMAGINVVEGQGPINIVPEPKTYVLFAFGLLTAGVIGLRRGRLV